MKKLTSFGLAILGFFLFFSCKKDNNGNSSGNTADSVAVLGKWEVARDVSYYYASSNGVFLDSAYTQVSAQDYFDFEKGGILVSYENDGSSNGAIYDTAAYQILQNKYLVVDYLDTINLKLSTNTDTLLLTETTANSTDPQSNASATEADTILLVK